jgi:hypothetical protein
VSLFHTEDNRGKKRIGGSFVPLDERRHWLYVNFAARNESLRQVCVWKGFAGRVEIESTNTGCMKGAMCRHALGFFSSSLMVV